MLNCIINRLLQLPQLLWKTGHQITWSCSSSELDRVHISIQQGSGEPLPELHGRECRLVVEGVPGFRNIKSVVSVERVSEKSEAEITDILIARLKDPMKMLASWERQLLAVSPKYDAYIERDPASNKPMRLRLYFPLSTVITQVEQKEGYVRAEGIVYSGESPAKEVEVCLKDGPCAQASLTTPLHGKGFFQFWRASLHMNKAATIVTARATDVKGQAQPTKASPNTRGLWHHSGMVTARILTSASTADAAVVPQKTQGCPYRS